MSASDAMPRVAVLARPGEACDRIHGALREAGADVVLVADPVESDPSLESAAAPNAILVALDAAIEDAIERYDDGCRSGVHGDLRGSRTRPRSAPAGTPRAGCGTWRRSCTGTATCCRRARNATRCSSPRPGRCVRRRRRSISRRRSSRSPTRPSSAPTTCRATRGWKWLARACRYRIRHRTDQGGRRRRMWKRPAVRRPHR